MGNNICIYIYMYIHFFLHLGNSIFVSKETQANSDNIRTVYNIPVFHTGTKIEQFNHADIVCISMNKIIITNKRFITLTHILIYTYHFYSKLLNPSEHSVS
jgi:hypothetical protein